MTIMGIDDSFLHKILKDQTRRNILHSLSKGPLTYMELMKLVKVKNTGKFNYHLKTLGNLIEKTEDGRYKLAERGQLAIQLLEKFPEKSNETKLSLVGEKNNTPHFSIFNPNRKKIGILAGGVAGGFCGAGAVLTFLSLFYWLSFFSNSDVNISSAIGFVISGPILLIIGFIIYKKAPPKLAK